MTGYQPDFDIDYRRGQVGEKLVGTFLEHLAGSTIEVKTDYRAWDTGNLYIETEQEINGRWVESGLSISKAEYYSFAGPTGDGFLTIPTSRLKHIVTSTGRPVHMARKSATSRDTRGYLIRVLDIVKDIMKGNHEHRSNDSSTASQPSQGDHQAPPAGHRESSRGHGSVAFYSDADEIHWDF